MSERAVISKELDSATFREYYYLKEELTAFCRENGLPASGSKTELTERIAHFLDTREVSETKRVRNAKKSGAPAVITADSIIEDGFVCSEKHRAFFKEALGKSFSFNVPFQKWLKANAGKTYGDAIDAYRELKKSKAAGAPIDRQFEYNTYIRDFFADNAGKTLDDAIKCWKYKKSLKGHNRYDQSDLSALERK